MLRDLTGGVKSVNLECETVGEVIERLEELYPGIRGRLCEGDQLRANLVVMVDGVVSRQKLRQPLTSTTDVHFVPVIAGGSDQHGVLRCDLLGRFIRIPI